MPYNGSGTFTRLYSWVIDAANSVNISSTEMDAEDNGFAAGLSNCITRDGQSPPSADLPMGGKKLTGLGLATTATDALSQAAGDARYILASATTLSLSGALTAGSLTANGNSSITGTLGVTGTATLGALNVSADAVLTVNNHALRFTDASGGNPFFIAKNDNTFGFYTTDATGAALQVTSVQTHNSTPTFSFLIAAAGVTPSTGDNSTLLATTAYVKSNLASYAPLASPTLTGTPAAPTAAADTATTQIATTAFVDRLRDVPRVTSGLARGKVFATAAGVTINTANPGEAYSIYNDSAASITLTQGAGVTLRLHGTTTTGNRTLAARGFATIWYNGSGEAIAMGDVA